MAETFAILKMENSSLNQSITSEGLETDNAMAVMLRSWLNTSQAIVNWLLLRCNSIIAKRMVCSGSLQIIFLSGKVILTIAASLMSRVASFEGE